MLSSLSLRAPGLLGGLVGAARRGARHFAGAKMAARGAVNEVLGGLPTTIFEEMSLLAAEADAINLGQGFPSEDLQGPASLRAAAAAALTSDSLQYSPMMGEPTLRQAIANHSAKYARLPLADWRAQVLVTAGAAEALAAAFLGLLNPGDEAVVLEPAYDSYDPIIRRAGGVPRPVRLRPAAGWALDAGELAAAFGPRTKLVVVNTPHNPTGKVFSRAELEAVAALCQRYDTLAVLDEVYEHLLAPAGEGGAPAAAEHVSLASLPGMAQRCLRVGSAGKTFSFTGLRVGWLTGPPRLVAAAAKAHQYLTFSTNGALQRAVAAGLRGEAAFFEGLGAALQPRRALLERRLAGVGFRLLPSAGTYFLVADYSGLTLPGGQAAAQVGDREFCRRVAREARVALIPLSAFYADAGRAPRCLVRFAFCKGALGEACDRLEAYFKGSAG